MSNPIRFLILSLVFWFFLLIPKSASAVNINTSHNPNPIFANSGNITITVSADEDFFTNTKYSFKAWHSNRSESHCLVPSGSGQPENTKTFKASWNITGCSAEEGEWKFQLWQGRGTVERNDKTLIVRDYRFSMEQASSSTPNLSLKLEPGVLDNNSQIKFSYAGLKANDCLAVSLKKGLNYLQEPAGLNPSCYMDSSTYRSYTSVDTSSFFIIEPLEKGDYEINIRDYKNDCSVIGTGCKWSLTQTSSIIKFTIVDKITKNPSIMSITPSSGKAGDKFTASVSLKRDDGSVINNQEVTLHVSNYGGKNIGTGTTDGSGNTTIDITKQVELFPKGNYRVITITGDKNIQPAAFFEITQTTGVTGGGTGIDCSKEPDKCSTAAGKYCSPGVLETAIGCIPTEPSALVGALLKFAAGGGGGIALLLMIFGAFRMVTSAGNPESLKAGREQFTSAVVGLLFVIFAVLLLQIIGVDILNLPGFSK